MWGPGLCPPTHTAAPPSSSTAAAQDRTFWQTRWFLSTEIFLCLFHGCPKMGREGFLIKLLRLFCFALNSKAALVTKQVKPYGKSPNEGILKQWFNLLNSHPPPQLTMRLKLTLLQKSGTKFS